MRSKGIFQKTICDSYESQITKFLLQFNIRKIAVAIIGNIKKIRETLQSYLIHSPIDAHNTYELAMTNMEVTPAESGTIGMLARYIYICGNSNKRHTHQVRIIGRSIPISMHLNKSKLCYLSNTKVLGKSH
jgi:hypothetical protein